MANEIFVQIAAYRDPQLAPTVRDMLAKADAPSALVFGVCWQHGPDEDLGALDFVELAPYRATLRLLKVPCAESRGLCWARSRTNALYRGEPLTMQIDSHHRFAPHWDTRMLEDYAACLELSPRPILTTYLPPFDPDAFDERPPPPRDPTLMKQYRFHPGTGLLGSMPWYIPKGKRSHEEAAAVVVRTRCLSGHFYLAAGSFVRDVPYDPDLYFGGEIEEVSMSIRAWTHGYDMFSPTREAIAWHEYTRKDRPKHWDDHACWTDLERVSRARFEALCGRGRPEDLGAFGVGSARSLAEYCAFAGIDFERCRIQRQTLDAKEPPNDPAGPWVSRFDKGDGTDDKDDDDKGKGPSGNANGTYLARWSAEAVRRDGERLGLPLKMLALGLEDERGNTLVRADVTDPLEASKLSSKLVHYDGGGADRRPAKFVLWPAFSGPDEADGIRWGTRQEGAIERAVDRDPRRATERTVGRKKFVRVSATLEARDAASASLSGAEVVELERMARESARSQAGRDALRRKLAELKRVRGIDIDLEYVNLVHEARPADR